MEETESERTDLPPYNINATLTENVYPLSQCNKKKTLIQIFLIFILKYTK